MSPRKKQRRLVIDILLPNKNGDRVTIRGSEPKTSTESLDWWQDVAEQMLELMTKRIVERDRSRGADPTNE